MQRFLISFFLLLLFALPAHGAPPKPRPYTGSGVLIIRPLTPQQAGNAGRIVLYREPGIGRVAEKAPVELPLLSAVMGTTAGEYPAAVMGKRGSWLKIAYDEAGREGWLAMERRWNYIPWEEFLPGRAVRLLPGLKKGYETLRREPSPSSGEVAPLSPGNEVRVGLVQGDWLRVTHDPQTAGWLRWRDDGGRFLVSFPWTMTNKNVDLPGGL